MNLSGKEGFSSVRDYGLSTLIGAGGGALTSALPAAATRFFPKTANASAKTMAQVYGERYPGMDNLLTRMRNSGIRTGLKLRVTAQELALLKGSGLISADAIRGAFERMRVVYGNSRIDRKQPMTKVHPQSEVERYFGPVDPEGNVTVQNPHPTEQGYVGVTEQIPKNARRSPQTMRDNLGIDSDHAWYSKYHDSSDPLFEVVFQSDIELDIPLPQTEAPDIPLGTTHPKTDHVAGGGITKGGTQEGRLPRDSANYGGKDVYSGAPIRVLDIRPVGAAPSGGYVNRNVKPNFPEPLEPRVRRPTTALGGVPNVTTKSRDQEKR